MDLTLARTIACSDEGCQVQLLADDSVTDAPISALMRQHNTRVHPGQIVALDRSTAPPEIRWRFGVRRVEALAGDRVTLLGRQFRLFDARPDDERATPIRVGDMVVVRSRDASDELEVYDAVAGGRPLHPERLEADLPRIQAIYGASATA